MESYTIQMSDVTPGAKFVLADIFISNSQNDHFTVTFSDRKDCLGTLYSQDFHSILYIEIINMQTSENPMYSTYDSGMHPPASFDNKSQKAIMVFDASQYGNAYPRWGQWT